MKIFTFSKAAGKKITKFHSDFVMTQMIQTTEKSHIGCMYLEENGIVGHHPALVPQLLFIVKGEGMVRGRDGEYVRAGSGDAVFFEKGEWHETRTDTGLIAVVVESEKLSPDTCMEMLNQ